MAYTGQEFDCEGASVKIATVELAKGGTTEVSCKEMIQEREVLNFGNYPDAKETQVKSWVEGSVSFQCDASADFPHSSTTKVQLDIVATGLKFSGLAKISEVEIKVSTEGVATGSFNFKSGPTYTLNNNPGA